MSFVYRYPMFLNKMYPSELAEQNLPRQIAEKVGQTDIRQVVSKPKTIFKVAEPQLAQSSMTVKIQFDALKSEVDRVRKHLRKPRWSARQIGQHTFEHFLKTECPE